MSEDEDSGKLGILGNGGDALLTAIADGNAGFTAYRAAEKPEAGTRNWRRERGTGDDALLTAIADGNAGFTAYRAAEKPEAGTRNWRRRIAECNRRQECWFYGVDS